MLELNFHPFPTLQTERLILREVTMADSQDVLTLRGDIDAMRYIWKPASTTLDEARDLISRIRDGLEKNTAIGWAITLKNNPQLIGTIGFHQIDKQHHRAEIGYMLLPQYWNKGLMSEAIKKVLDFGFNTMELHSIQANIDPNNMVSAAILKKFNFEREAYFKENFFFNGKFMDSEIYSLLNKQ
jgi:ribosomal-protein-alanine N-acetyltransferase